MSSKRLKIILCVLLMMFYQLQGFALRVDMVEASTSPGLHHDFTISNWLDNTTNGFEAVEATQPLVDDPGVGLYFDLPEPGSGTVRFQPSDVFTGGTFDLVRFQFHSGFGSVTASLEISAYDVNGQLIGSPARLDTSSDNQTDYELFMNFQNVSYFDVTLTNGGGGNDDLHHLTLIGFTIENPLFYGDAEQPVITSQPIGVTVDQFESKPLLQTVAAINDSGTLSYQWYSHEENANEGGIPISGATSSTYEAPTEVTGTTYYYAIVTNTNNQVNGENIATTATEAAPVTVNPKTYTITFDSIGGSDVTDQVVEHGDTLTELETPMKPGFTFIDWYIDETYSDIFHITTPITIDMTLYAKWKANEYIVNFQTEGGSEVHDQTVRHGEVAEAPEEPEKVGHTFVGWYTTPLYDEAFDFTSAITGNTTLYAKWEVNAYTVQFESNGGSE
ncbi:InlB B-repeat-containing protein, partial [Halalkalibacter sp. AB-rgal2]|uniref:InlB B-repeat-containing protein n=1 Tax=Halalkalibacter sp. AB-rgal2 TaxID=3242695 RepID=UPI00359DDCD6